MSTTSFNSKPDSSNKSGNQRNRISFHSVNKIPKRFPTTRIARGLQLRLIANDRQSASANLICGLF